MPVAKVAGSLRYRRAVSVARRVDVVLSGSQLGSGAVDIDCRAGWKFEGISGVQWERGVIKSG